MPANIESMAYCGDVPWHGLGTRVPDLRHPGVQGTLWTAYNTFTRFEDYRKPRGEDAELKLRALNAPQELPA